MNSSDKRSGAPLGVCVLPSPTPNANRTVVYPEYIHEILAHAGVCYQKVAYEELPQALPQLQLLLTVGECAPDEALKQSLQAWVEAGGAWMAVAGTCGLSSLFGVEVEAPSYSSWGGGLSSLGEGYLAVSDTAHRVVEHLRIPLHYFNGLPVRLAGGKAIAAVTDAHQRATERVGLVESLPGKGICLFLAADVTGTVVRIQQGVAITRDGVPAADGTAPVSDAVLKTDDGAQLDWIFDRQPVPGVPGFQGFLEPVADAWKELLLRSLFYLASEQDVALPLLWLYPSKLPALAHLSHDTDLNEPDNAWKMLDVVNTAKINSTWCTIMPGYSKDIIEAIRSGGHELAMHYDAMSEGTYWSEQLFDEQWQGLVKLFDGQKPTTNKNHYLRWEGDTEFYTWCAKRGIQLDESKGASKTGEAGYGFGTCHPFFPVDPKGEKLDVMELCTPTQDLGVFAPPPLFEPLLSAATRFHGICHLLFHPAHISKPGIADTLASCIAKAKQAGLEWWTAARINKWERARRQFSWLEYRCTREQLSFRVKPGETLEKATVMIVGKQPATTNVNGNALKTEKVHFWGFDFYAFVTTLESGNEYECTLSLQNDAQLVGGN